MTPPKITYTVTEIISCTDGQPIILPTTFSYAEYCMHNITKIKDGLDLDSLLIQLQPQMTQTWKVFANVVGLSNMIKQLTF